MVASSSGRSRARARAAAACSRARRIAFSSDTRVSATRAWAKANRPGRARSAAINADVERGHQRVERPSSIEARRRRRRRCRRRTSGPSTAAALNSCCVGGGKREVRRRTTSCTAAGTSRSLAAGGPVRRAVPSATSSASTSRAKNGLPLVRPWRNGAETRSGPVPDGRGDPLVHLVDGQTAQLDDVGSRGSGPARRGSRRAPVLGSTDGRAQGGDEQHRQLRQVVGQQLDQRQRARRRPTAGRR